MVLILSRGLLYYLDLSLTGALFVGGTGEAKLAGGFSAQATSGSPVLPIAVDLSRTGLNIIFPRFPLHSH
jgi:hypothetical protein